MNMYKTFGTLFTIACLLFSANSPARNSARDTEFVDVSANAEYAEEATYCQDNGLVSATKFNVQIGNKNFTATLSDNTSAKAFAEQLPMTLNMSELNGNEKYYFMPNGLPTNAERVGNINSGDIMLYGSDCLVLFYENFQTSYSYTRLGHIDDASGLANALGAGSVQIVWSISE